MENKNKKNSFDKLKAFYVLVGISAAIWILGIVGETDLNDAKTFENQNLGYEKNVIKKVNTLEQLFDASVLLGISCLGWYSRDRKNQKTR